MTYLYDRGSGYVYVRSKSVFVIWGWGMIKKIIGVGIGIGMLAAVVAYFKVDKIDRKKVNDVAFEVVDEENIPVEIEEYIDGFGKEMRRGSYLCSDGLYIVVYYGEQTTDGYSIDVREIYESKDTVFIETVLMGPKSVKEIKEEASYPYVVIKIPVNDKKVVFI